MSRVMEVSYNLNPSGCKVVKVSIELGKECEVKVFLYKPGGTSAAVSMSCDEFLQISNQESIISSYFSNDQLVQKGSSLILNSTLRVRFENTYQEKMLVLERLPKDIVPSNNNTIAVFMMEKSWMKLVELLPVLSYVVDQRVAWCDEVDKIIKEISSTVREKYPEELEAVKNIKDFNKILANTGVHSIMYESIRGLDVERCALELFNTCQTNLLTACRAVEAVQQ